MITVIGGDGFIGGHVVRRLEAMGLPCWTPHRHESLDGRYLGDVVFCAGVTGDFRYRPLDTVDAHVGVLSSLLGRAELSSLVYLSSTRLYRSEGVATEGDVVRLLPSDPDHLYDLSKALGEALALSWDGPVLLLRLANVYGIDLDSEGFLAEVLREVIGTGRVTLRTSLASTRNYVSVEDVVDALLALMDLGARGTYNIAAPPSLSHRELTDTLSELTGCQVSVAEGAPTNTAPDIDVSRLSAEIDYRPESVLDALPRLVDGYRRALNGSGRDGLVRRGR